MKGDEYSEKTAVRAVYIAAMILHSVGLCLYEDQQECQKTDAPEDGVCIRCIARWLLTKAKREIRERKRDGKERDVIQ